MTNKKGNYIFQIINERHHKYKTQNSATYAGNLTIEEKRLGSNYVLATQFAQIKK